LLEGIQTWENSADGKVFAELEGQSDAKSAVKDTNKIQLLLKDLGSALETRNAGNIESILDKLLQEPVDSKIRDALQEISDIILMTEYEKASENVRSLLAGIK